MISMISLDGYNLDKMDEIEQTLIDAFISQDEIDDADEFVQKNAPAEYIQYLKDYQKVKERFRREGILAWWGRKGIAPAVLFVWGGTRVP